MRISNYPTDTLDGTELILATNQDTTTQKYKTVNFTIDTLKTYIHTDVNDGIDKIIFEGDTKNDFETTLNASDPTADRTISLPNQSGTIPVLAVGISGNTAITATPDEINYLDITTLGTVEASKVATADANGDVLFPDDQNLKIGTGSDLKIYHSSSNNHSYIHEAGSGTLIIRGTDVHINNAADTKNMITAVDGGAVTLFCDHVNRLATTTVGVTITGALTVTTNIDVDGTANLDDVDIDGNVQLDGTLTVGVDDTGYDVKLFGATAGRYVMWDESEDTLQFSENAKLQFKEDPADGGDLANLYMNQYSQLIMENTAGPMIIGLKNTNGSLTIADAQLVNTVAGFSVGGSCSFYHANSKKLETTTSGIEVTGGGTFSGDVDVTRADNAVVNIKATVAGSGARLKLKSADNDNGYISFDDNDDTILAQIKAHGSAATGGNVSLRKGLVFNTNGTTTALTLYSDQSATFAGTITSGAITSTDHIVTADDKGLWFNSNYHTGLQGNDSADTLKLITGNAVRLTASNTEVTATVPVKATQFKLSALNTAPSSASDTGTLGEVRIDADYIYVCTASNTWRRAQIATW